MPAPLSRESSELTEDPPSRVVTNLTAENLPIKRSSGTPYELSPGETHEFKPNEVSLELLSALAKEKKVQFELRRTDFVIRNLTPYRIGIERKGIPLNENGSIVIPAFGERTIDDYERSLFDIDPWVRANLVKDERPGQAKEPEFGTTLVASAMMFGGVVLSARFALNEIIKDHPQDQWPLWVRDHYWTGVCILAVLGAIVLLFMRKGALPRAQQSLVGFTTFLIGVGTPAIVIFWDEVRGLWSSSTLTRHASLAEFIQFTFISIASMMPAALFFLFDRQRVRTLRETFLREVTRLDPQIKSLADAESIYGARVNEAFGEPNESSTNRVISTKRGPVIIATILITAGWFLVLRLGKDHSSDVMELFRPNTTPIAFGFVGAYVYAINMLFRRYTRSDLKPKAYSHVITRILTTTAVCWVLTFLPGFREKATTEPAVATVNMADTNGSTNAPAIGPAERSKPFTTVATGGLLMLCFVVGWFPQTGINLIIETVRKLKKFRSSIPSSHEKQALSELEGISLYDRTRLIEEGIENIENLAHHDLIDLVLHTRIPVPRLVDWVDQAILYLHVGIDDEVEEPKQRKGATTNEEKTISTQNATAQFEDEIDERTAGDNGYHHLRLLKQNGIRNATGLQRAYHGAGNKEQFLQILGQKRNCPPSLEVMLNAIRDEQWMVNLQRWREFGKLGDETRGLKELLGKGA